jgi:hypothetical protein
MRRFSSTPVIRVDLPVGPSLRAWVAEARRTRLAGLAGLRGLPPGAALLLPRCRSLHTFGMRFAIDVAFVSWPPLQGRCRVVALEPAVAPGRVVSARGRTAALEARAGTLSRAGVRAGAVLLFDSAAGRVSGRGGAGTQVTHSQRRRPMFEKFRRHDDEHAQSANGVGVRDREPTRVSRPNGAAPAVRSDGEPARSDGEPARSAPAATAAAPQAPARRRVAERSADEAQLRRREEFGGLNWGAAFFGWLVAIGLAALLVAIVAAAGTALGLSEIGGAEARANAETIGIGGGVLLVAILALAYFAGGYVAGRMSRFDGARQGIGVWLLGLLATIALAIAGVIGGSEYNVLERLELPRIPIEEGDLTTGGAIALGAVLVATLLAAVLGGRVGHRYHRRVDAAGWDGR